MSPYNNTIYMLWAITTLLCLLYAYTIHMKLLTVCRILNNIVTITDSLDSTTEQTDKHTEKQTKDCIKTIRLILQEGKT